MDQDHDRSAASVLVIDDDAELCQLLARFLGSEGFDVEAVQDGHEGVRRALSGDHDVIILDVMLPDMNGFDVLRRIRAASRTPILMLTARGDARDRILGLVTGADDYLPKPFVPQELTARLQAILRRARPPLADPRSQPSTPVVVGDIELDGCARVVRHRGEPIELTTVEFDLLDALLRAAGTVVSREDLARDVLGREFSPFDRSIDTHVYNLRKKVGRLEDGTERIKGIRGVGYLYAVPSRP